MPNYRTGGTVVFGRHWRDIGTQVGDQLTVESVFWQYVAALRCGRFLSCETNIRRLTADLEIETICQDHLLPEVN